VTRPTTAITFGFAARSGAFATIVAFLFFAKPFRTDAIGWIVVAILGALGGLYTGSLFLAWQRVRDVPVLVLRVVPILAIPSLVVLGNYRNQVREARSFLAIADSAEGRVVAQSSRNKGFIRVSYKTGDDEHLISGGAPASASGIAVGDEVWIYYLPSRPDSATIGRPAGGVGQARTLLGITWLLGGPLVLAFGGTLRWWAPFRCQRAA